MPELPAPSLTEAHISADGQAQPDRSAPGSSRRRTRWIVVVACVLVGIGAVGAYRWTFNSHDTWTAIVNDTSGPVTVTECNDRACAVPVGGGDSVAIRAGASVEHLVGDTTVTWFRVVAPDGARCLELATAGPSTPVSAIPAC
jgi:uncharacterized cupin superfamily protein